MISLKYLVVLAFVAYANAKCPEVSSNLKEFDIARYENVWYEYSRSFFIFETLGECVTANYSKNEDGTVNVVNSMIVKIPPLIKYTSSITGKAKVTDTVGLLQVTFFKLQELFGVSAPYLIIDTDYDNYAVVYSCTDNLSETAWILTRKRKPADDIVKKAEAVLANTNIKLKLNPTNQNDCGEEEESGNNDSNNNSTNTQ